MCEDFAPNFGDKKLAVGPRQHTISQFLYIREFLTENNTIFVPNPSYFPLFFRLKIKLKIRHFETIEMIEAESKDLLNIHTEHDFQDAFKKWRMRWEPHTRGKGLLR
jgi:hypothetical protein